jgi:hypothetical protein
VRKQQIGSAMAVLVLGISGFLIALPGTAGADAPNSSSATTTGAATSCSSSASVTVTSANTSSNPATGSLTASCTFANNTPVTISNGGSSQSTTSDGSGGLDLNYSATDPTLSVDGGPFEPAQYGVNTVVATGNNPAGGTNTATFLIDIVNPNASTGASSASGSATVSASGGLAFTGADLAALIAAALALILMGSGVVIYTRRRAAAVAK